MKNILETRRFFQEHPYSVVHVHAPHSLLAAETNVDRILGIIRARAAGPCNKRFKKSIIEANQIMFKNDLTIGEDFVFGVEYMLCCKSSSIQNDHLYFVDETNMSSITRAARYDDSQYLLIYKYAFKIALNSAWGQAEKARLVQQLDYLFCRTAFAGVEHLLRDKGNFEKNSCDFVRLFYSNYKYSVKPINMIHFAMRLCIRFKITPAFKFVAYTHLLTK